MLVQHQRRWPNNKPALVQRRVFAGLVAPLLQLLVVLLLQLPMALLMVMALALLQLSPLYVLQFSAPFLYC